MTAAKRRRILGLHKEGFTPRQISTRVRLHAGTVREVLRKARNVCPACGRSLPHKGDCEIFSADYIEALNA